MHRHARRWVALSLVVLGASTVARVGHADELACSPPTFSGVARALPGGQLSGCAVTLDWKKSSTACGPLRYNVYRSTTPGVPPGPGSLLASCVTGTTYRDQAVTAGTPYYYVVRAEDASPGGGGPCQGGQEDVNAIELSSQPAGPWTTVTDGVEGESVYWDTAGGVGSNVWARTSSDAHVGAQSWLVADPDTPSDQSLTQLLPAVVPARFKLEFWQRHSTEAGLDDLYDGGVLEYSLDGGATWHDILDGDGVTVPANAARFLEGGYAGRIATGYQSPLAGRLAWGGESGGWQRVRVDLSDLAGRPARLRWRFASDESVAASGWWLDDVRFRATLACSACPFTAKGDFTGDGRPDLIYAGSGGAVVPLMLWEMDGAGLQSATWFEPRFLPGDSFSSIAAADDFNRDGRSDLLVKNRSTSTYEFWLMNGVTRMGSAVPLAGPYPSSPSTNVVASGDFNADGWPDLVWSVGNSSSLTLLIWTMNGVQKTGEIVPSPAGAGDSNWNVIAALDTNGDGNRDFIWYNWSTGKIVHWWMDANVQRIAGLFNTPDSAAGANWKVWAAGDYGVGPGGSACASDLFWVNYNSGNQVLWYEDLAATRTAGGFTSPTRPTVDPDGNAASWNLAGPR